MIEAVLQPPLVAPEDAAVADDWDWDCLCRRTVAAVIVVLVFFADVPAVGIDNEIDIEDFAAKKDTGLIEHLHQGHSYLSRLFLKFL